MHFYSQQTKQFFFSIFFLFTTALQIKEANTNSIFKSSEENTFLVVFIFMEKSTTAQEAVSD